MPELSKKCVRRLRKATEAACSEAQQLGSPADMWKLVLDVVYPVLQEQARLHAAAHSGARGMPDEVLVEVFGHLSLWDRVRTATVCHKWRGVSLGASVRLWTTVPPAVRNLDVCAALLDRAGGFPVTWRHPNMDPRSVKEFSDILKQHLHHIKVLDFGIPEAYGDEDFAWRLADYLVPALTADAPLLESVRIVDAAEKCPVEGFGFPVLRGPALANIELEGLPVSCLEECAGSASLRSLRISTPENDEERLFRQDDWSLICSFPALESLSVRLSTDIFETAYSWDCPLPRSLRRFHLEAEWDIVSKIVDANSFDHLESWRIAFPVVAGRTGLDSLQEAAPLALISASYWVHDPCVSFRAVSAAGQEVIVQDALYEYTWGLPLAHLTRLCLGGFASSPFRDGRTHAAADLPRLEELVLDLTPASRWDDAHPRLHVWPRMACPALRILTVRSAVDRPPITLTDFAFFLEKKMGIQAERRIPTLVLDRVIVEPPHGGDLYATLRKYAKEVSMVQSEEIWPECQRVWNKKWEDLACT